MMRMNMKPTEFTIVVKNRSDENLRTFDFNQFEQAVKWMQRPSSGILVSAYRIQLVPKGESE